MVRWFVLCSLALIGFSSCKPEHYVQMQGYILGDQNDIRPLDITHEKKIPDEVINASVLIATKINNGQMKFCSGSLVEPAEGESSLRVLTNHHCFANVDEAGQIDSNWVPVACLNTKVYFGYSMSAEEKDITVISCKEHSLRSDVEGDLAVFTLERNPPDDYKSLKIKETQEEGEVFAYILHYPDVAANYRTIPGTDIRLPAASITETNCMTKGAFPVSEWHLDKSLAFSLRHTCDLVQGSSGSALIDAETHEILGVNWGGIKINYRAGSQLHNVATGSDFVIAFLSGNTEDLKVTMRERLQSADVQRASANVEGEGKEKKSVSNRVREAVSCGHIGSLDSGAWSLVLFLIVLTLPIGLVKLSTRQ